MKGHSHSIICTLIAMVTLLTSCRDELCYNHFPAADMNLSWLQEWERDHGMAHVSNWDAALYGFEYESLRPGMPEWVTMIKYQEDGTSVEKYLDSKGGQVILDRDESKTKYLFFNGDTEYIVLSNLTSISRASASATSRTRPTIGHLQERHPNTKTTNPPDILYTSFVENLPNVGLHEVVPMPICMEPRVFTYVVRYEFEHGIEHVALARGALAGMAESVYLLNGSTSDKSSIILYDCDLKSYGCEAIVRSFGAPSYPESFKGKSTEEIIATHPCTLNLELMLQNGRMLEFNYDVSDQIARQPQGGVIKISGIRVEDEQNQYESGFDVDVSGWGNHEDIDLPVTSVPD